MNNILVTSQGASWPIIPELPGFTNPDDFPLYHNHPQRDEIAGQRSKYVIEPVTMVLAVTTSGDATVEAIRKITHWKQGIEDIPEIHFISATGIEDLSNPMDIKMMSDLIYRTVLYAKDQAAGGKLYLSLAGGRKNMSVDIHLAATIFGCDALLHVTDNGKIPDHLRNNIQAFSVTNPAGLSCFLPLVVYEKIHAGEDMPVKNIREAVYHLSAERIGHALTLNKDTNLKTRIRERKIALELCPSGNDQIVGYRDFPQQVNKKGLNIYPLKNYLDSGLKVTVNTDNPGISRTDLTREYYKACTLTEGGLSHWEILQILRNGFLAGFYPIEKKKALLLEVENEVTRIIDKEFS